MSTIPQCHYGVLGIGPKASDAEIKKAYRNLSLQWHPDRNVGREEQANEMYIRIQEAHEVLTDSNEKAWYDSNREALLRGEKDEDNIHLGAYFVSSCYRGFDGKYGFYNIYNDLFLELSRLEMIVRTFASSEVVVPVAKPPTPVKKPVAKTKVCSIDDIDDIDDSYSYQKSSIDDIDGIDGDRSDNDDDNMEEEEEMLERPPPMDNIPVFGDANTSLSEVKRFYSYWMNFMTYRSLGKDQWYVPDAENRRVKRLMIADNKKKRAAKKKEFNDQVRKLASTIQKRDPRWKDQKALELQEERDKKRREEEQKKLEEERKRLARIQKSIEEEKRLEEQRLRYLEQYGEEDDEAEEEQEEEEMLFYCHECIKGFKSDGQLKQHKESRKHKQQVEKQKSKKKTMMSSTNTSTNTHKAMSKEDKEKDALRQQQLQEEEMFRRMFEEKMNISQTDNNSKNSKKTPLTNVHGKNAILQSIKKTQKHEQKYAVPVKGKLKSVQNAFNLSDEEEDEDEDEEDYEEDEDEEDYEEDEDEFEEDEDEYEEDEDEDAGDEDEEEYEDMEAFIESESEPEPNPFECKICSKVYTNEVQIQQHLNNKKHREAATLHQKKLAEEAKQKTTLSKKELSRLEKEKALIDQQKAKQETRRTKVTAIKSQLGINVSKKSMKKLDTVKAQIHKSRQGKKNRDSDSE